MDWLIQHVCADELNKPIAVDPYGGCPAGTHERRLAVGEDLPYYRHDQPGQNRDHPLGFQRHDAYPLVDRRYGGVFSANDFDFDYVEPYGVMHPGDGDGFDVYRVAKGWVTGGGTRDGGGYSASFFGADCKPFDGWVFFPVGFLRELRPGAEGRAMIPITGSHWEQAGEPWPGRCEIGKGFSKSTLTTWTFEPGHEFGGRHGTPKKQIDAVAATHGSELPPSSPLGRFHLERIHFTDLYGATRWEAWISNPEKPPHSGGNCGGPTTMTYEGNDYVRTDCRDWSVTEIYNPPRPHVPWPYPETNILSDWHFNNDGLSPWLVQGAVKANPRVPGPRSTWGISITGLAFAICGSPALKIRRIAAERSTRTYRSRTRRRRPPTTTASAESSRARATGLSKFPSPNATRKAARFGRIDLRPK